METVGVVKVEDEVRVPLEAEEVNSEENLEALPRCSFNLIDSQEYSLPADSKIL